MPNCSICGTRGLIEKMWINREGVPHGSPEHNVSYSTKILLGCPQCKRGWLQSYSHDCWAYHEDEPWDMYWWFMLEQEDMQRLDTLLEECPTPLDPQCSCDLHHALRNETRYLSGNVRHEETPYLQHVPFTSLSLIETEKGPTLKKK
jgi:hypothetical protein